MSLFKPITVGSQASQICSLEVRAKRGNALVWVDGKEEVVFSFQHAADHGLHDGIARDHEAMINRVAIKFKGEMEQLVVGIADHRMAKAKALIGRCRWNGLRRPRGDKSCDRTVYFHKAKGEAWRLRCHEVLNGRCVCITLLKYLRLHPRRRRGHLEKDAHQLVTGAAVPLPAAG
jgi:hypothetical protein